MYPVANLQTCDGTLKGTLCVVQFHLLPSSPGHTPGDLTFFFIRRPIPRPRVGKRRQFPAPGTPIYLNHVCMCTKKGANIGC